VQARPSHQSGYLRSWVFHPPTRVHVGLLGPCFKTGQLKAFRQLLENAVRRLSALHALIAPAALTVYQPQLLSRKANPSWPVPSTYSSSLEMHKPGHTHNFQTLPPQQFQALFNSLFKVLFIFPSRYLFAIGLSPVFSLRWDLPPT
jgi:hypothetical protein